jgi:hypothetical protein
MPEKVCLVVGMLSARMELFGQAEEKLCARFGPVLRRSAVMPFDFTDYYTAEMGQKIHRQFLAFERPIAPNTLCEIKLWTNALEQQFVAPDSSAPRTINLDPGLLYLSRLILATTKDNAHRIYLDRGIYAEVTLIRRENAYQILPWTYPDYRTAAYRKFFEDVRTEIIQRRPTATSRPGGTCK